MNLAIFCGRVLQRCLWSHVGFKTACPAPNTVLCKAVRIPPLPHSDSKRERERERATRGDRVSFSSVGLWEGFLGVRITRIPYRFSHSKLWQITE